MGILLLESVDATFITNLDGTVSLSSDGPITSSDVASSASLALALHSDPDVFQAPALAATITLTVLLWVDGDDVPAASAQSTASLAASLFDDGDTVPAPGVAAAAIGYIVTGFDAAFSITPVAAIGYVITGSDAAFSITPVAATGYVITGSDAAFVVKPVEQEAIGGGGYYVRPPRPFPVVGIGYGILPLLWGEAHGVVGVAGQSAAQFLVRAAAIGACGQAGVATVVLKGPTVAGKGAVGTRGAGKGVIVKFSGSATGRHDDDEAAVIAFLLAA